MFRILDIDECSSSSHSCDVVVETLVGLTFANVNLDILEMAKVVLLQVSGKIKTGKFNFLGLKRIKTLQLLPHV